MNFSPMLGRLPQVRLISLAVLLLLGIINIFPTSRAVAGQSQTVATSKLAGIALPPGAERILDAKTVKESTTPLSTIAAGLNTPTQVQATEVLAWGGAGYKREKSRAIIAQVQTDLQKTGFQTQKVGGPQSAQGNTLSFFVAGSAQQKKALVGYWLENDQLLMLVWGQFGTTNAPSAAPNNAGGQDREGAAGAATATPTFPKLTAKPNQATGVVLTRLGKPLASARIRFWRLTPNGAIIEYTARTNAQGLYSVAMPPSRDYRLDNATALVRHGEYQYYLPLRPEGDDGSFFDRDAIDITKGYVKNFVLPISGHISPEENPKEELSYYGGSVTFRANVRIVIPNDPDPALTAGATGPNAVPEGTRIQLTLTPQGPLLDGSTGRPAQLESAGQEQRPDQRLLDNPNGHPARHLHGKRARDDSRRQHLHAAAVGAHCPSQRD
jgi:hypothetical protein